MNRFRGSPPNAYEAGLLELEPWGEVTLAWPEDDLLDVSWEPAPPFEEGSLRLSRLTSLTGHACPTWDVP